MDRVRILQKRMGYANVTLLVNGENAVLVDTGLRTRMKHFQLLFGEARIEPDHLRLIVLTHTHYDHTGNLAKLARLTEAPVLVHRNEYDNLKRGFTPIPDGHGRYSGLISRLGKRLYPIYASPKAYEAELISEEEFELKEFGFDAKIIHTPGHTMGSQSVLLGNKLIAGDTFIHLSNGRIFPPFVNDPAQLLRTWERLFEMNIETVYPGHGKRFSIEKAYPDYTRWKEKLGV